MAGSGSSASVPEWGTDLSTNRVGQLVSIVSLDLGTNTGWAVAAAGGATLSGSESFRPGRFEGGGMRYLRFRRWLTELKATVSPIEAVYFEEVRRHAGVDAAHAYGGFLATLTAWCEHHQIPYQGVPVGTIKRHATGKGNADKATVMAAIRAQGFRPVDDNEADALALLAWARAQDRVDGGAGLGAGSPRAVRQVVPAGGTMDTDEEVEEC